MSQEPSRTQRSHQTRVTLVLAFLASDECRRAGHQILDPERFAYEWCRIWFDEVYVPSFRYLNGLKGDRSEEAADRFRACFTDEEMAALERFHRFLELRVEMLSEEDHERESFPQNDAWDSIVRHAGYVLEDLEAIDSDAVRGEVAALVSLLAREGGDAQEEPKRSLFASLNDALQQSRLPE